jgi:CRP-like cAMP-binding protein
MIPANDDALRLLQLRLAAHKPFGAAERDLLASLPWRVEDVPARRSFVREGDKPKHSCLILQGLLARSRYTVDGQRQILSIHVPGDMPDLQSLQVPHMDHDLETVVPSRIAFVPHAELRRVCDASPLLASSLWRESLIDAALHRAAIFRNGQLEAEARLAHFLCEMYLRLKVVGLVDDDRFDLALSQQLIGDVLGLTLVSINKAVQALRARELIRMEKGHVDVLNWNSLSRLGQFDGAFLHLEEKDASLAAAG